MLMISMQMKLCSCWKKLNSSNRMYD
jgi:hypothetical protein